MTSLNAQVEELDGQSVRSGLRCAGEQASGEVSSKSLARDHCRGAIPGYITRLSFCARFACWEDDSGVVSGDMLVVCRSSNSINLAIIARVAFKSAILASCSLRSFWTILSKSTSAALI